VIIQYANITGEGCPYAVDVQDNYTNVVIRYSKISNGTSSAVKAAFDGGSTHIYKNQIYGTGIDAIKIWSNVTVQQNYITKVGYIPNKHADGVQIVGGKNNIIAANNFDMLNNDGINSQCLMAKADNAPLSHLSFRQNWVRGAGQCVQIRAKSGGAHPAPSNYEVLYNKFGCGHQFTPTVVLDGTIDKHFRGNYYLNYPYDPGSTLCSDERIQGQYLPGQSGI